MALTSRVIKKKFFIPTLRRPFTASILIHIKEHALNEPKEELRLAMIISLRDLVSKGPRKNY